MAATEPASPIPTDSTDKEAPGTNKKSIEPTAQLQWMYQPNVRGNSGKKQQDFAYLAVPMFINENRQFEDAINSIKDFGKLTKIKRKHDICINLEPFGEANKATCLVIVSVLIVSLFLDSSWICRSIWGGLGILQSPD